MTGTYSAEVSAQVPAAPAEVLRYFTDPGRFVRWMGAEARLEPVPGGQFYVRMPDGFRAAGEFVRVDPPHQVVFTWGFADEQAASKTKHQPGGAAAADAMPPGSTRVTVTLRPVGGGTRVTLRHDDLPGTRLRDGHQVAWEAYLPRLVIAACGGDPGPDPHS
jgi:uncharacterized protein YndB with AHSA1/START domain